MSTDQIKIYSFTLNEEFIFTAYITAFSDSYSSNWKTENVFGKMDAIATFQNTARKITMEFDVPSSDFFTARQNFINVSKLISGLYPTFNDTNKKGISTIGSPPLFRIKYANLVSNAANSQGLLCYFDSGFTFNPDFTAGVFNTSEEIYPKLFKASLAFTVLHEQPLGRDSNHLSRLPENKNFPYNIDNLTQDQASYKKFEEDFKQKNGSLAAYLKQLEQQKAANARDKANSEAAQVKIAEETRASNIIESRLKNIAEQEIGTSPALLKVTNQTNTGMFTIQSVSELTAEDIENNKKAQLALYNRLNSGERVKVAVLNNGQTTGQILTGSL